MAGPNFVLLITCSLISVGPQVSKTPEEAVVTTAQAADLVKQLDAVANAKPRHSMDTFFAVRSESEAVLQKLIRLGSASEAPLASRLRREETRRAELEAESKKKLESKKPDEVKRTVKTMVRSPIRHEGLWGEFDQLSNNLQSLTALRRVQRKPDPLLIQIVRPTPPKAIPGKLPTLNVMLTSADIDKKPIWCETVPNGHGTHRYAQYRFEVQDASGKILPVIPNSDFFRDGGSRYFHWLELGEYFHANLPMHDFVEIREPGEYTVTVLYHPTLPIADITDPTELDDLIIFRSASFKLTVEKGPKLVLTTNRKERQAVNALITRLPNEGEIKVIGSGHQPNGRINDQNDFGLISPQSPAGQILKRSWQAVPALFDALSDAQMPRHRKTWVLSLLYSIIGEDDLDPGSIGVYPAKLLRAFQNTSAANPTPQIDPHAQDALIEKWKSYRGRYLDIRESDDR